MSLQVKKVASFAILAAGSTAAWSQGGVTLYGLIDAGLMYTNNVTKGTSQGALIQTTSGEISGSRFGLRGYEDLGGSVHVIYVLESGFNVQNGKMSQNSRLFGRQSFVGIESEEFGTLTLGRQYDSITDFVEPLSGVSGTLGDFGFSHPFDNDNFDHSVRSNNAVKYSTTNYRGLRFGGTYAFSNNQGFANNRAYSFGAAYRKGPLHIAAAYLQVNASNSTTNLTGAIDTGESVSNGVGGFEVASEVQRTAAAAVTYDIAGATAGFAYSHSQYVNTLSFGSNHGEVRFDNFELNVKYGLTRSVSLGGSYTYTDGLVTQSTTFDAHPKWNQVNLQTVYSFSKRTDFYAEAMYQHVSGRGYAAYINGSGGASSSSSQFVGTVGMRTRF